MRADPSISAVASKPTRASPTCSIGPTKTRLVIPRPGGWAWWDSVLRSTGNLRFGYDQGRRRRGAHGRGDRVIDDVSIEVAAGDVVGILGPNGSGKTTLLRLLSGAVAPLAGWVQLGGTEISRIPRRTLAQQIALVPQETSLAFDYTVLEIVLMGRYPHLGA